MKTDLEIGQIMQQHGLTDSFHDFRYDLFYCVDKENRIYVIVGEDGEVIKTNRRKINPVFRNGKLTCEEEI